MADTAKACLQIIENNQQIADDIKRFVLPFDKNLATAYFRLDNAYTNTFFEHVQKDRILGNVRKWMKAPEQATRCAFASNILKSNRFSDSPEDMVALASLASLLRALSIAGYARESLTISDVMTNYILYESSSDSDGSFRKLCIAAAAELLSSSVLGRHKAYTEGNGSPLPDDLRSEAAVLNGLNAFGNQLKGGFRIPGQLQTIFDYVPAAYYCLTALRERNTSQLDEPTFAMHFQQLSSVSELPQVSDSAIVEKMEDLLRLTTIAALCGAAAVQLLHGVKGLSYNGSFIRHLQHTLVTIHISGISKIIIDPIASLLALLMETNNWSPLKDDTVAIILNTGFPGNDNWSLVNLALKRCQMAKPNDTDSSDGNNVLSKCLEFLHTHSGAWQAKAQEMIIPSVQNGWFALIQKSLCAEELTSEVHLERGADFIKQTETAFRGVVQAGYPYVMKRMVESLGIEYCKRLANLPNDQGITAVHLACKHRAPKEAFRLLQILSGNVNSKCHSGRTPLSYCFPDQTALPSLYQSILDLISEFSLPTTAPLDKPKAYGGHVNGKPVDPRTDGFRGIINQLICRNADISIPDSNGMTPLHLAAKEGWGDNLDVFFMHSHGEMNRLQKECLTLRDYSDRTVLDYSRMAGDRGVIQGREDILVAEMTKRAILVPPKVGVNMAPVEYVWISPPPSRPRPPTPEPATDSGYVVPSTNVQHPSNTQSPRPHAPRFPPPQVYQDPSIAGNRNRNTPFPPPKSPLPQVYRDPGSAPNVYQESGPNQTQARTQFSPPQIFQDQQATALGMSAYPRQPAQTQYLPPSSSNLASPQNQNHSFYSQPTLNPVSASPGVPQGTPSVRSASSGRAPSSRGETVATKDLERTKESKRSKFLGKFTGKK